MVRPGMVMPMRPGGQPAMMIVPAGMQVPMQQAMVPTGMYAARPGPRGVMPQPSMQAARMMPSPSGQMVHPQMMQHVAGPMVPGGFVAPAGYAQQMGMAPRPAAPEA